jgi:hypothetical protein
LKRSSKKAIRERRNTVSNQYPEYPERALLYLHLLLVANADIFLEHRWYEEVQANKRVRWEEW